MTSAFSELGTETANLSQEAFEKTERFVAFRNEKRSTVTTVKQQNCRIQNTESLLSMNNIEICLTTA